MGPGAKRRRGSERWSPCVGLFSNDFFEGLFRRVSRRKLEEFGSRREARPRTLPVGPSEALDDAFGEGLGDDARRGRASERALLEAHLKGRPRVGSHSSLDAPLSQKEHLGSRASIACGPGPQMRGRIVSRVGALELGICGGQGDLLEGPLLIGPSGTAAFRKEAT
ncbi:hypothetical protein M885DRAFT_530942 [Pelagophyceae sp. CCMP2097]|nr:hypothetical protein M885DRAFT_530942 [Pelagophyceae sp. CCMP2097]